MTAVRRIGTLREPGIVPVVLAWIVAAALVLGTNLGTGGDLSLDGGVLRYDGNTIGIEVRDFGERTKAQWEAAVRVDPLAERAETYVYRAPAMAPEKRAFYALAVAQMLAILGGVLCLERLLRRAARRRTFADQGAGWLRGLAGCVAVGAILVPFLMHAFERHVLTTDSAGIDGPVNIEAMSQGPGPAPFVIVLLLLGFAEAWRRGAALREDVEATV